MNLIVKETKLGRGVFTLTAIKAGDVVEECPIIEIPVGNIKEITPGVLEVKNSLISPMAQLSRYTFDWTDSLSALALGFGSLYNHSWQPNLRPLPNYNKRIISFVAVRDIAAGEELYFNYQYDPQAFAKQSLVEKQIKVLVEQESPAAEKFHKLMDPTTREIYQEMYKK